MVFVIVAMIRLKMKLQFRPFQKRSFYFGQKTLFPRGIILVQTGIPCTKGKISAGASCLGQVVKV
jgi:hypothetical protein